MMPRNLQVSVPVNVYGIPRSPEITDLEFRIPCGANRQYLGVIFKLNNSDLTDDVQKQDRVIEFLIPQVQSVVLKALSTYEINNNS
jgi:hypothetical protein